MTERTKLAVAEAWPYTHPIVEAIILWLSTRDKKRHVHFRPTTWDRLRLLKLRTWSLKYHLSYTEILDLVVRSLRSQVHIRSNKEYMLGVSIRTLTSAGAERIIQEKLAIRYPNSEHIQLWLHQERERQLERERAEELEGVQERAVAPLTLLTAATVDQYVTNYTRRVSRKRQEQDKAEAQEWRKERAYRNNPWR